jgi:2-polyprenyl-3-methyl-5-hydroxy-6-metoxy-1,4-benzoquinol methylase
MAEGIYENYTSTSVLAGVDVKQFTAWSTKYFTKNILPHFPPSKEIRVLEIGCGYGRYLRALLDRGYANVYGIDISEEQIRFARENMRISSVEQVDALDYLHHTEHSYDVVLLLDVMEHLEVNYSIELLRKIYGVLNKAANSSSRCPTA